MKEHILKLRRDGLSYRQIQTVVGCSKSTISYYCDPLGPSKVRHRLNELRRLKREYQRKYINRVKTIFGCKDCGLKDYRILDFDHVREYKSFNISSVHRGNYNINEIKREMRKCEIRCSNCHRIKTYEERRL